MKKILTEIRVGGVPEHFNMPWHWAMEKHLFKAQGLALSWKDFPGGTGAMNRALREKELDIAIVLTEGIIADIMKGNPSQLLQFYVQSPLLWGIHVPAHSHIQQVDQLRNLPFAISRKGSGSHLMAAIMTQDLGWKPEEVQYKIVGNLKGAREALAQEEAYGFLWEKFTTQPYVDNGEFRRVGDLPTPWPCFSIAVRTAFWEENKEKVNTLLEVINQVCATWKQQENLADRIAERYGLKAENVSQWLTITEWNTANSINETQITQVVERLVENGIVEANPKSIRELLAS